MSNNTKTSSSFSKKKNNASSSVSNSTSSPPPSYDHVYESSLFSKSDSNALSQNTLKAFHTALCFIPPRDVWEPIQQMREHLDKAYQRWPPHINLLFPFISEKYFDAAAQLLKESMKSLESFDLTLSGISYFDKKTAVMYLDQDDYGKQKLVELQSMVAKHFPYCDEKKNEHGEFVPHLTVGQCAQKMVQSKVKELNSKWKPVTFKVEDICMIYRPDQETSFAVIHRIPLGGQ
ncbi:hypothetical protein FDP41_009725 [Naegleria fowleri]|uniref:Uncharacterized protein n=1 Tax=Naegleria fowleri TaxID=5763 RepID=A0A6A5BG74_NAEFO|nr:uncharacterized protein FDP41_009725 [Naegleria fowleri]KAF0972029.1 hypothetical protein FDP41_009725 [Naegleria fowleri]CAG4708754.1 unnamed protein product [Naegleria fowleri]